MLHLLFHFLGLDNASGTAYLAWSGFGGDVGEVTVAAGLLAVYRKHNCHARWCFRLGRHGLADESSGLTYRLCRRHHPQHPGGRALARHHITRIHERNQGGQR